MIVAQRIVRSKGSRIAIRRGKLYTFANVNEVIRKAQKARHVFSILDGDGNEGTIRSGRMMRRVDSHVKNVTESGLTL